MAPALGSFPLSELPDRSQEYRKYSTKPVLKTKTRKPPIDLETCDLYELVQYSCTTQQTLAESGIGKKLECFPFARLFRRCGEGDKIYHVETTAWEGEHAFTQSSNNSDQSSNMNMKQERAEMFAEYGKYFWSKR